MLPVSNDFKKDIPITSLKEIPLSCINFKSKKEYIFSINECDTMKITKMRLLDLLDRLRSTYIFLPAVMMLLAFLLAHLLTYLEGIIPYSLFETLWYFFHITPGSLTGYLINFTTTELGVMGVVFSVTLVPLTMASSQYGTILLRAFLRDIRAQIVLGLFAASMIFNVTVLLIISRPSFTDQVPVLSATTALVFLILDVCALIYFFHHVTNGLQASTIISRLGSELSQSIREDNLPGTPAGSSTEILGEREAAIAREGVPIGSGSSGYIRSIDYEQLLKIAQQNNLTFSFGCTTGDFIGPGDTLLVTWPKSPDQGFMNDVRDCFMLGEYRTMLQDPEFGITQLVNIVARSANNDPSIPVMVLNQIGVALEISAERGNPSPYRQDSSGTLRMIAKIRSFDQLMISSFDLIRYYTPDNTHIITTMLNTIGRIANHARSDEIRKVLLHHAILIEEESVSKISSEHDRQLIRQSYETAVRAIGLPADGFSS